jgi:hypothetical protein
MGICSRSVGSLFTRVRLTTDCDSDGRLIRSGEPAAHHLNESAISLKPKLAGFSVERRLVRGQSQLVLNKRAERLCNEVELPGELFVSPTQPVQPDAESFVQFGRAAPLEPRANCIGENRGL